MKRHRNGSASAPAHPSRLHRLLAAPAGGPPPPATEEEVWLLRCPAEVDVAAPPLHAAPPSPAHPSRLHRLLAAPAGGPPPPATEEEVWLLRCPAEVDVAAPPLHAAPPSPAHPSRLHRLLAAPAGGPPPPATEEEVWLLRCPAEVDVAAPPLHAAPPSPAHPSRLHRLLAAPAGGPPPPATEEEVWLLRCPAEVDVAAPPLHAAPPSPAHPSRLHRLLAAPAGGPPPPATEEEVWLLRCPAEVDVAAPPLHAAPPSPAHPSRLHRLLAAPAGGPPPPATEEEVWLLRCPAEVDVAAPPLHAAPPSPAHPSRLHRLLAAPAGGPPPPATEEEVWLLRCPAEVDVAAPPLHAAPPSPAHPSRLHRLLAAPAGGPPPPATEEEVWLLRCPAEVDVAAPPLHAAPPSPAHPSRLHRLLAAPAGGPPPPATEEEVWLLRCPAEVDVAAPPLHAAPPSLAAREQSFNQGRSLTGLKNLGNTCYMNSIIQCLKNTDLLVAYFCNGQFLEHLNRSASTRGCVAEKLAAVVRELYFGQHRFIDARDLRNELGKHQRAFRGSEQQDSHEFLTILLDRLHLDLQVTIPHQHNKDNLGPGEKAWQEYTRSKESPILQMFYGQIRSTVLCKVCGKQSVTYECFSNLSLELPAKTARCLLSDCLKLYLDRETVSGWQCDKCKAPRDALKKLDIISRLPPVLVIHFKRFCLESKEYDCNDYRKNDTYIDFPLEDLDMRQFALSSPSQQYKLYAVSNHYGSMEGGHYTAYCHSSVYGKWYKYDDDAVSEISPSEVTSSAAYILFYQACPTPYVESKTALKIKSPAKETKKRNKILIVKNSVIKMPYDNWHSFTTSNGCGKCLVCQVELRCEQMLAHAATDYHYSVLGKPFLTQYYPALLRQISDKKVNCVVCNSELANNKDMISIHVRGRKHTKMYEQLLKESVYSDSYADCYEDILNL